MQIDRAGLRVLTRDECLALLATVQTGRIAVSSRALPVILPVQFVMDGDRIVTRTHHGSTLDAATNETVVAFETDGAAEGSQCRWNVHVNGIARHVTDPASIDRLASLELPLWPTSHPTRFVAISTDHVAGQLAPDTQSVAPAGVSHRPDS